MFEGYRELNVNANLVPYLQGLKDCDVPGADELMRAIEKHDEVELWLDY